MKQNNFVKRSLKFAAWMMAHISWLTMAFSPVALAKQAENINTQSLKLAIQDLKLNQKITVKEFWDKTKSDYPGYAYYEMEEFVKQNPNALMPRFEVRSVKGSDGSDVPVLAFVENGKTHTIQVFGDEKNYIKFDGVSMTEAESTQPEKIFQKLIDNNPKLKKEYNDAISKEAATEARQYRTEMKTQTAVAKANKGRFSSFNGFARITPQMWAAMSLKDRAQYLVLMRQMWTDARQVNFYSSRAPASQPVKQPVKKTAPKKTSSLEKMYQLMIGENAEAETGSPFIDWTKEKCEAKGAGWVFVPANSAGNAFADCIYQPGGSKPQTAPTERKKTEAVPAKSSASKKDIECINAGWITQNNSKECSYDFIRKGISNRYEKAFMAEVVQECGTSQVSCNPLIFGYQNNGKIKCIGTGGSRTGAVTDNPQKATWFGGPCDVVNPLNTSASGALADSQLRSGRNYNQNRAAQLAAIEKDQAKDNFKLTEQYLDSVLKRQGKGSLSEILKQPWNAEVDDLLVQNQKIFEDEINRAIEICERDAADLRQKDTNQMGACDQLHRRWLFTEQFVSKYRSAACPDETDYIYDLNVLDGEKKAPTLKTADNRTQNQNKNNIVHNKTKVADLKADTDKDGKKLLCSCVDSSGKTHKFPLGSNKGSDESAKITCAGGKEEPPVAADACKSVVETDKSLAGAVVAQGDKCLCKDTNIEVKSELGEHSEVRYYCGQTTPVAKKCEQYDEAFRSQLDDDCLCKNKKGDDTKRKPKTVNTGFKAIFTSSKNNSDQQADGKRYTCNQGPNWWVIGGIAAGTAGLLALLLHNKKKCPPGTTGKYPKCVKPSTPVCPAGTYGTPPNCAPNTCPAGQVGTPPNCTTPTCDSNQTGTYPNCVTCEPPKVIVSGVCQCAPCGQISVCGQMVDQTQNPVTCQCTPVPSEGGCGTNPDDDGGWGGTAQ